MKRNLELNLRQEVFDCLILPTLELVPTKADPTTKKQSCKRGMVGASGAGGIEMILAVFRGLLNSLRVRDDGIEPGRTNPYRILSLSESLLRCTWRKLGWELDFTHRLV